MELFKASRLLFAISVASFSGATFAGPQVIVNFKNNTGDVAVYSQGGSGNQVSTYANASPKPTARIEAGGTDRYAVRANGASPITYATVRYQAGTKSCQFTTGYMMNSTRGGVRTPKWNKSVVSAGGASCDVNITSTNFSSYDWVVDFAMR